MDLLTERRDRALWLTLNRPDKRNALTPAMITALDGAIDAAEADPAVRSIVITGAGPAFCAGADLGAMLAAVQRDDGPGRFEAEFLHPLATAFSRLRTTPLPVVAAVNGACAAGGLELVLCCDVVIAARRATFCDAHAQRGIAPAVGAAAALVDAIGAPRAKRVLMLSETFDGATLAEWGLVHEVVTDDALEAATTDLVATLATRSGASIAAMKRMVLRRHAPSWPAHVAADLADFTANWGSTDMREGIASFVERRAARFD